MDGIHSATPHSTQYSTPASSYHVGTSPKHLYRFLDSAALLAIGVVWWLSADNWVHNAVLVLAATGTLADTTPIHPLMGSRDERSTVIKLMPQSS